MARSNGGATTSTGATFGELLFGAGASARFAGTRFAGTRFTGARFADARFAAFAPAPFVPFVPFVPFAFATTFFDTTLAGRLEAIMRQQTKQQIPHR
jgi:hypothetical protein